MATVRLRRAAGALGVLASLLACGGDDGAETNSLADSGSLAAITSATFDVPTTVALTGAPGSEVAWVAESQFDHYEPFGGDGNPGPFRVVGVPLAGGSAQQISLPDDFFPEGITASPGGRLYIGSIADGSILTVAPNSTTAELFLPARALSKPSVLGMTVSNDGGILWVCNTVTSAPAGTLPSADIVGIGAADRQIKYVHPLPSSSAGAFCNDLTMAPNGNLWATESFGGRIFRITLAELSNNNTPATEWLQSSRLTGPNGPQVNSFGVNGLTLVSNKLFVVNSSGGTLLSIDPSLAKPSTDDLRVVELQENGVDGAALLGNPDGITRLSDTEILVVENGFCTPSCGGRRLSRVALNIN